MSSRAYFSITAGSGLCEGGSGRTSEVGRGGGGGGGEPYSPVGQLVLFVCLNPTAILEEKGQ